MGLLSRGKKPKEIEEPDIVDSAPVSKAKEKRSVTAIVFQPGVPAPWCEDVEISEKSTFKLKGRDGVYSLARGSGWRKDGVVSILVNTENAQTIGPQTLASDRGPHPIVINDIAESNWAEQMVAIARRAPAWKTLTGWGIGIAAFLAIGALLWNVLALGGGFDELTEAVKGLDLASSAKPQAGSGHNAIAPG